MNISEQLDAFLRIKKISKKQMANDLSVPLSIIYNASKTQGIISNANFIKLCQTYDIPSYYFTCFDLNNPTAQFDIADRIRQECIWMFSNPYLNMLIPEVYSSFIDIQGIMDKTHFPTIREIGIITISIESTRKLAELYYGNTSEHVESSNPDQFQILLEEFESIVKILAFECKNEKSSYIKKIVSEIPNNIIYESSFDKLKLEQIGKNERVITLDATFLNSEDEKLLKQMAKYLSEKNKENLSNH